MKPVWIKMLFLTNHCTAVNIVLSLIIVFKMPSFTLNLTHYPGGAIYHLKQPPPLGLWSAWCTNVKIVQLSA